MTRLQWLSCWDRLRETLNTRTSWGRNQIIEEMDRIEREMVRESETEGDFPIADGKPYYMVRGVDLTDQEDDIPFPSPSAKKGPLKTYDASFKKTAADGKTYWVKIGIAFGGEKGRISISIDSIPLNWDGKLTLFEKPQQ